MAEAGNPPRLMRIMQILPSADWERIWTNLNKCWATEAVTINWYVVIHDILPTNGRLHKIRLVDSTLCGHCREQDTVQYRGTARGEGARIWVWTKQCISCILRIDPAHIPPAIATSATSGGVTDTGPNVVVKKVEHALGKITATFCDGHAGRRIRPNIAGPTLGTIFRSYFHDPTRGTHRGAAAPRRLLLQCFGNCRSGTEIDPCE